jgi:hypothetical protein
MKPLDGILILDLTHRLSGPYGAMFLTGSTVTPPPLRMNARNPT